MQHWYELFLFSFHDHTGITHHLEKMALKGWLLDRTGFFWAYRKAPRQYVRYAVTYFPSSSDFNPTLPENEAIFRDFCESAGWEFVAQAGEMQIFRSFRPDPIPLDTEPMVQVETIHRSMKGSHLKNQAVISGLMLLQMVMLAVRLVSDPLNVLKFGGNLLSFFSGALLLLEVGFETVSYFRWHKKALQAAEEGSFLPTAGRRWPMALYMIFLLLAALSYVAVLGGQYLLIFLGTLAGIFGGVAAGRALQNHLKARGVKSRTNRILSAALSGGVALVCMFVMLGSSIYATIHDRHDGAEEYTVSPSRTHYAYHDELPLYMEDLLEVDGTAYSNRLYETGSFFLRETQVNIHRRFDRREDATSPTSLDYTLWRSPFPAILDLAVEDRLEWYSGRIALEQHYVPLAPAFGAEAVWQLYDGENARDQYLLRFERCVIEIDFDFPPTDEQMAAAMEKLLEA